VPHPSTNAHGRARPRLNLELTEALPWPFAAVAPDAAVLRRSPAIVPASRTYDLARAWSRQQSRPSSPDSQWHSEYRSVAASFDLDVATLLVARRTLRCPQSLLNTTIVRAMALSISRSMRTDQWLTMELALSIDDETSSFALVRAFLNSTRAAFLHDTVRESRLDKRISVEGEEEIFRTTHDDILSCSMCNKTTAFPSR
jgi:hypothetical protein